MSKLKRFATGTALLMALSALPLSAFAEDKKQEAVDELWGTPVFVYGSALSESQISETKNLLGVNKDQAIVYEEIKVSGEDMVRLLGRGNPKSNMFSSATIEYNQDKKGGIVVEVVTPSNITAVSQTQYANALITAGAEDVVVKVGSPVAVTGQSALTGIYKAYEESGQELDKDRMEVAQQEIEVTSSISKDNGNSESFNTEMLTKTMVDIKEKISTDVIDGDKITEKVATEVINSAVEKNGLSEYITQEHVDQLVKFAMDYSKTDAAISPEVLDQLDALKTDALNKAQEFAESIGQKWEDVDKEGFFEGVKSFFNNIFSFFADIFKSEEVVEDTPIEEPVDTTVIDENSDGEVTVPTEEEPVEEVVEPVAEEVVVEEVTTETPTEEVVPKEVEKVLLSSFDFKEASIKQIGGDLVIPIESTVLMMSLKNELRKATEVVDGSISTEAQYEIALTYKDGTIETLKLWIDDTKTASVVNVLNPNVIYQMSDSSTKKVRQLLQP